MNPRRALLSLLAAAALASVSESTDLMTQIFQRGRITSREHYEFAVDVIGIAEDEGLLGADQVEALSRLIGAYEDRRR